VSLCGVQVAVTEGCKHLGFVCLAWNKLALKFYRTLKAVDKTETEQWHLFRLNEDDLQRLAVHN